MDGTPLFLSLIAVTLGAVGVVVTRWQQVKASMIEASAAERCGLDGCSLAPQYSASVPSSSCGS